MPLREKRHVGFNRNPVGITAEWVDIMSVLVREKLNTRKWRRIPNRRGMPRGVFLNFGKNPL